MPHNSSSNNAQNTIYANVTTNVDPNQHLQQPHQWYQAATDGSKRKVVHQVLDGGTGSVSKLDNSQD